MEIRQIGQLTEIQASGGGNFLTQATPTNFHTFFKKKILVGTEKPSDFNEVTAQRKVNIENADAKWERPPQAFIDQWYTWFWEFGCGGYNEQTGFFEANELYDITYAQALRIMQTKPSLDESSVKYTDFQARTNVPLPNMPNRQKGFGYICFRTNMETVRMCVRGVTMGLSEFNQAFNSGYALHTVCDNIDFSGAKGTLNWDGFPNIKKFTFRRVAFDIKASKCPKISLESWRYAITNRVDVNAIAFTVHTDVMAKLTGDTTNTACATLTDEERAQWASLLELAVSNNVTFATV